MPPTRPMPFDAASRPEALLAPAESAGGAAPALNRLCKVVARHFDAPAALLSLTGAEGSRLLGAHGLGAEETRRALALCERASLAEEGLTLPDVHVPPRPGDRPGVAEACRFRFCAGAPLVAPGGARIGALCLLDTRPRPGLAEDARADLAEFAALAAERLAAGAGRPAEETAEQEAALDSVEEVHAYLAHELRTPLGAVVGLAELARAALAAGRAGPETERNLVSIAAIGQDVLALAEQTLRLARLGRPGLELAEEPIALGRFAEGLADTVRETAEAKGVALGIRRPPALTLTADRTKLGQMCRNLLQNAVRHTPAGGQVEVAFTPLPEGGLEICVADEGPGMTETEVMLALSPLGRIGRAGSADEFSLGLGLPLTRRLVELHGGRLVLGSAPGRGTRARLVFPAHRLSDTPPAPG